MNDDQLPSRPTLAVVIPFYNEQGNISTLLEEVDRALAPVVYYELIAVWDLDAARYSYYLGRPVRAFEALNAACDWLGTQHRTALVIYPRRRVEKLERVLPLDPVLPDPESEFAATHIASGSTCRMNDLSGG